MEEYNFCESLRPTSDNYAVKKRTSVTKNGKSAVELDVTLHNAYMREFALMRIKFPFLTELQVQGRTLDKFCIPNLMGKPYRKNKGGAITTCTITHAIRTAEKSLSERKFRSARPKKEVQRRHTIAGTYIPIDITINKIIGRRNSRVSRNLYNNFTLYSDEMEDDDYSIQASSTDDSGLEDFRPENQSHTFELNFMSKPSETIKAPKTYGKYKHPKSNTNDVSRKDSILLRNLKQLNKKANSNKLESSLVSERKVSNERSKYKRNEMENLQIYTSSDCEGDIVENSVGIAHETPYIDERQKSPHESLQHNASVSRTTKNRRKSSDFITPSMQRKRKKFSISPHPLKERTRLHSSCKRIKQSISQVSLEYLENVSTDYSDSTVDGMDLNSGYLCGIRCLSTPKPHLPLVKVNLSVCSQDNKKPLSYAQETTHANSRRSTSTSRNNRKCSESVPYIDESSLNDSDESPMSDMDEGEKESYQTPGNNRKRKSSCSSMESNTMMDRPAYSPYIIHVHSSQGTASECSYEEHYTEACPISHAENDFGEFRGNFSPQIADSQYLPGNDSCISQSTLNSQQSNQLFRDTAQATTIAETRSPENNALNHDGYFLANLFDEFTNQPIRRTLRSSMGQYSSSQEDDGALIVE